MDHTFFSADSLWILSHTVCVSEVPGSRTLFAVILPKIFSTDWRGISFSNALHTSKHKHTFPHQTYGKLDMQLHTIQCNFKMNLSSV